MTTTLTNDQITAGAAVLCDHGQPIGRNAAIEVADAMQAAGPAMADLDLDKLQQHATMFRDIESFHPGHFRTLKIFANNTLDLIGLARCAPSPQVAEKVKDAELIELAKLAGYTFARTTTAGVELLAGNVEAHERLMSFGALAIAASRRAAGGEASAALREAASDYANGTDWVQRSTVVAWLRARAGFATPAPASAGQATPAAARNYRDEEFLTAARVALVALAHAAEKHGIYQTDHDRFAAAVEKFAAQPAEVSAGQAGQVAMLAAGDVKWIVNDNGELGVKIGQQCFFCYKGDSLVYQDGLHDDGTPMLHRLIGKREFGEVVYPAAWQARGRSESRYTVELKFVPGLSFGSADDPEFKWTPLPVAPTERAAAPADQPSAQVKP